MQKARDQFGGDNPVLIFRERPAVLRGAHSRYYEEAEATAATRYSLHDSYPIVHSQASPDLVILLLRMLVGVPLVLATKPVARLVYYHVDEHP